MTPDPVNPNARVEPLASHEPDLPPVRTGIDAVTALTVFLALLVGIPSGLVIGPLGAIGSPAAIVGYGCLTWWCLGWIAPRLGFPTGRQPIHVALTVFSVTVLASYGAAAVRPLFTDELAGADRAVITMLGWLGVALLAADGVKSEERLERLLRRLVVAASFLALMGILQFFFALDIARYLHLPGLEANADLGVIQQRSVFRRVSGTAAHPIEFGVALAMAFPLALHFATNHRSRPRDRDRVHLALITFGVLVSVSRSGILGLAAASLVMFLGWDSRRRLNALFIAPLCLIATRFVVPGLLGTIKSLYTNLFDDPSVEGRTNDYELVGEFIGRAPVFGRGFGTFNPIRYFYLDNQYLGHLIETGIIGSLALFGLFLTAILCARGVRRRSSDPRRRDLGQALAAAVLVPMVTFVTFDGFGFAQVSGFMFLIIGCCGAYWRLAPVELSTV